VNRAVAAKAAADVVTTPTITTAAAVVNCVNVHFVIANCFGGELIRSSFVHVI